MTSNTRLGKHFLREIHVEIVTITVNKHIIGRRRQRNFSRRWGRPRWGGGKGIGIRREEVILYTVLYYYYYYDIIINIILHTENVSVNALVMARVVDISGFRYKAPLVTYRSRGLSHEEVTLKLYTCYSRMYLSSSVAHYYIQYYP